jgi:hypothetical protein
VLADSRGYAHLRLKTAGVDACEDTNTSTTRGPVLRTAPTAWPPGRLRHYLTTVCASSCSSRGKQTCRNAVCNSGLKHVANKGKPPLMLQLRKAFPVQVSRRGCQRCISEDINWNREIKNKQTKKLRGPYSASELYRLSDRGANFCG